MAPGAAAWPCAKAGAAIAASISAVAALRRGAMKSRRMADAVRNLDDCSIRGRVIPIVASIEVPPCEPILFLFFEGVMRAGSVTTRLADNVSESD